MVHPLITPTWKTLKTFNHLHLTIITAYASRSRSHNTRFSLYMFAQSTEHLRTKQRDAWVVLHSRTTNVPFPSFRWFGFYHLFQQQNFIWVLFTREHLRYRCTAGTLNDDSYRLQLVLPVLWLRHCREWALMTFWRKSYMKALCCVAPAAPQAPFRWFKFIWSGSG